MHNISLYWTWQLDWWLTCSFNRSLISQIVWTGSLDEWCHEQPIYQQISTKYQHLLTQVVVCRQDAMGQCVLMQHQQTVSSSANQSTNLLHNLYQVFQDLSPPIFVGDNYRCEIAQDVRTHGLDSIQVSVADSQWKYEHLGTKWLCTRQGNKWDFKLSSFSEGQSLNLCQG